MAIEDVNVLMDSATAYLRELCAPGMDFILILGTTDADGRSVSYETNLPRDRAEIMLGEALELAREEDE